MSETPAASGPVRKPLTDDQKKRVNAVFTEALRASKRTRRTKYEVALDALVRVAGDFTGSAGVAIEDALAVLRERVGADEDA